LFLGHNLPITNGRKIKCSEEADFRLDCFKRKAKKLALEFFLRHRWRLPKPFDTQHTHDITRRSSKPKMPGIFLIESRRIFAFSEGFNSYLAQSAGELWLAKSKLMQYLLD